MLTKRNGIIILFLMIIGLAVWQNYQLRMEQKTAKEHVTKTAFTTVQFLKSAAATFENINKENQWDDLKTRNSQQIWLSYTFQSLSDANNSWQDYANLIPNYSRQNINDVFFSFSNWFEKAMDILGKEGVVTAEEKVILLELSEVVSKVDLPQKVNDFNGISVVFERLAMELKSVDIS
ncbi:hypothetical protein [Bacillus sp. FJAT-28004]|uniref:hypothetical protein n=1 Tax=Bacillus sp. FJAT-28004 TaxID=1679165 RepID=UPI0006B58DC6|nr:hypothetical protein [Bacillus sp. FJAT-28004]